MDKLIEQFNLKLNNHFYVYKSNILKHEKEEIFAKAYQIHFYECLHDYLSQYEWDSSEEHKNRLKILCRLQDIFNSLWNMYIENEWLGYISWEEIDDLMGEFYRQNIS